MRYAVPFVALAAAAWPAQGEVITFYKDITPIVYASCAPCHRPGEAGPFPLLTYEDVKKHAQLIAKVTKRRYMPPWLPDADSGIFHDERRLTDKQIQTIEQWVKQGAQPGSPAESASLPKFTPGWQLGTPDLVLEAPAAYRLREDGPDEYWNFVLPVKVAGTRWVKAIEIRPGNARALHHANVLIDRSHSARMQEKTPGGGFAGMDLSIEADTFDPDSHFLFWKPGGIPWEEPDGMSVLSENADDAGARRHLGEVFWLWGDELAAAHRMEEAVSRYRESLSFLWDDAQLHSDLGTALAKLGRFREAVPEFETALRLDPKLDAARNNLQAAKAQLEAIR